MSPRARMLAQGFSHYATGWALVSLEVLAHSSAGHVQFDAVGVEVRATEKPLCRR